MLSYRSRRSSLNPRPVNLLQPLDSLFLTPILCFQQLAASFHKTPGVGVLFGFRPTIQSLTSAFATVTHSLSRKSFPCHSYANTREGGATRPSPNLEHLTSNLCFYRYMRHVAPLSPVPSLDCAYLPSPRGVYPLRVSDFRALVANPIGSPFVFILLPTSFPATPLCSHPSNLQEWP